MGGSWGLSVCVHGQFLYWDEVFLRQDGSLSAKWKTHIMDGPVAPLNSQYTWAYVRAIQIVTVLYNLLLAKLKCKDAARIICRKLNREKRNHIWHTENI